MFPPRSGLPSHADVARTRTVSAGQFPRAWIDHAMNEEGMPCRTHRPYRRHLTASLPSPPGGSRATTDAAKAARPWYRKKRIMIPLGIVVLAAIGSGLEQPSDTDQVDAAVAAATPSDEPTTQEPASPEPSTQEATTPEPESEDAAPATAEEESVSSPSPTAEATPEPTSEAPAPEPTPEAPAMTREQENAVRQAGTTSTSRPSRGPGSSSTRVRGLLHRGRHPRRGRPDRGLERAGGTEG